MDTGMNTGMNSYILDFAENIHEALDKGEYTISDFLDSTKAFHMGKSHY